MKFSFKTGILASLLVLPVLFFLFLKTFGENHFSLPVFYPIDSVLTASGKYNVRYHTVPPFKLVNEKGDTLASEQLSGKIYVTDFFFTSCPGICPKMTNQLKRVQESFSGDKDIKIVSISVDPIHDTPEELTNYAKQNGANTMQWYFLTGNKDTIYTLAQQGFYLSAGEEKGNAEAFVHSDKLVLVDKEGRIRGYYNGTTQAEVDRLITEINVLIHEYANNKQPQER